MFCRKCGKRIGTAIRFCPACGCKVEFPVPVTQIIQNVGTEFKAMGSKPWVLKNDCIVYNNSVNLPFEQITGVRLNNTADTPLINGVIVISTFYGDYVLAFSHEQKEEGEKAYETLCAKYGSAERKAEFQAQLNEAIYLLKGVRGRSLRVYENRAVITVTAETASFITEGGTNGEQTIHYKDCTAVSLTEEDEQIGCLRFETAVPATNDSFNENCFTFDPEALPSEKMREVRDYIAGQIENLQSNRPAQSEQEPPSLVDEIKKYKALLDCGAITQEEFEAKKKQLLGL